MNQDIWFYAATIAAVILLGLAKGGLAGAGLMAMPLMSLAMPPLRAASILLPILILQDLVAVKAFWRSWDATSLRWLIPGGILGVVLGYLLAASASSNVVEGCVGGVAIGFSLLRAFRPKVSSDDRRDRPAIGWLTGIASGFTSQIAHAGAPPFQIYMLSRRLPGEVYLGTAAIFFMILDATKLPAFIALGQMSADDLLISALMGPLAIVSSWAGVGLMRRLSTDRLYGVITAMLLIVGVVLVGRAFY